MSDTTTLQPPLTRRVVAPLIVPVSIPAARTHSVPRWFVYGVIGAIVLGLAMVMMVPDAWLDRAWFLH